MKKTSENVTDVKMRLELVSLEETTEETDDTGSLKLMSCECPRYDIDLIIPCCETEKNLRECPIECNCMTFEEPQVLYKQAEVLSWGDGDLNLLCDILFLPNLYEFINFNITDFTLRYDDLQNLRISISFILQKDFVTEPENMFCKEAWKSGLYPDEAIHYGLVPLIGFSLPIRGFHDADDCILVEPTICAAKSFSHWIIASPSQRSLDLNSKQPESVNYISTPNLLIFGKMVFNTEYKMELKFSHVNKLQVNQQVASTKIGLILPFGELNINSPSLLTPSNFDSSINKIEKFTPIQTKNYPGEQFKNFVFLPCRLNKAIIGKQENSISIPESFSGKPPILYLWEIENKPNQDILISLLVNDRVINPKLLPVLEKFYGKIANPINLNIINFGIKQELVINCTNNYGDSCSETVILDSKSEINFPLPLNGILNCSNIVSIDIEVLSSNNVIYENSTNLTILPEDHLLLRLHDIGRDWFRDTHEPMVCWVTPDNMKVLGIVDEVIKKVGINNIGPSKQVEPQIRAIWDTLKEKNIKYEIDSYSIGTSERASYQRISYPQKTLYKNSGNCLDLTILFASVMRALLLEPIIVLKEEHSFLGWELPDESMGFLETIYVADKSFEKAIDKGFNQYIECVTENKWKIDLKISDLRSKGFYALF